MRLLHTNEYSVEVWLTACPVLICKFSETEYCTLFPKSSGAGDADPFVPQEKDRSLFRGDPETDEFYTSLEDLKRNAVQAYYGGPSGDLATDKTEGRYYEVLGVLLIRHMEEAEGSMGWD